MDVDAFLRGYGRLARRHPRFTTWAHVLAVVGLLVPIVVDALVW